MKSKITFSLSTYNSVPGGNTDTHGPYAVYASALPEEEEDRPNQQLQQWPLLAVSSLAPGSIVWSEKQFLQV